MLPVYKACDCTRIAGGEPPSSAGKPSVCMYARMQPNRMRAGSLPCHHLHMHACSPPVPQVSARVHACPLQLWYCRAAQDGCMRVHVQMAAWQAACMRACMQHENVPCAWGGWMPLDCSHSKPWGLSRYSMHGGSGLPPYTFLRSSLAAISSATDATVVGAYWRQMLVLKLPCTQPRPDRDRAARADKVRTSASSFGGLCP